MHFIQKTTFLWGMRRWYDNNNKKPRKDRKERKAIHRAVLPRESIKL